MEFIRTSLYMYIIVLCSSLTSSLFPATPLLTGSLSPSCFHAMYTLDRVGAEEKIDTFLFPLHSSLCFPSLHAPLLPYSPL